MTAKRMLLILVILASPLLGGCAQLSVKVAIFKREDLNDPALVRGLSNQLAANATMTLATGKIDSWSAETKAAIGKYYGKLVQNNVMAPADRSRLEADVSTAVDQRTDDVKKLYLKGIEDVANACVMQPPAAQRMEHLAAIGVFTEAQSRIHALVRDVMTELDDTQPVAGPANALAVAAAKAEVDAAIDRASDKAKLQVQLFDDPYASLVVYSSEASWRGCFNETYGSGRVGNTDIAVKMDDEGIFTMKGVRVDASKFTKATFQSMSQGLRMLAAVYGVPLPAGGGASDAAQPDASGLQAISRAEDERLNAEAALRMSRVVRLALLDSVLMQEAALADPAKLPLAVDSIKGTFAAYKGQLESGK